ncbi:hypothetical protein JCM10207_001086 [Rhodosporidiobolus poonsookiae]
MASPDPTLLLQDLLSPPSPAYPPSSLARQLSFHLASLPLSPPGPLSLLALLTRYAAESPALWDAPLAAPEPAHARIASVYEATRQGALVRLEELTRPTDRAGGSSAVVKSTTTAPSGGSYAARRALHAFVATYFDALASAAPGESRPLAHLAMASGVLSALQEWKRRKEALWVGGGKALGRAEREVGRYWAEWTARGGAEKDSEKTAAWLAAQTVPFLEVDVLAKDYPVASLLRYLTDAFSSAFAAGQAFSSPPLSADLALTPDGLSWAVPSSSHSHITSLVSSHLFPALGPLSRAIGRTAEAAAYSARTSPVTAPEALSAIQHLSSTLLAVSTSLSVGWASTAWSDLLDDSSLAPATRTQTAPWTLLKSLLFAQTLIYSSLLQIVSPPAGDDPTPVQRLLATEGVRALGKTYFVALKFGQTGFAAWRAVLAGLVEVVAAPLPGASSAPERAEAERRNSPAEVLVRSLQPEKGTGAGGRHDRAVERAEATFWMNTVEQVMREIEDEYVEERVLRGIRPYLDDASYHDTFEAAHSVMLAVFAANKRCVHDVAPWYTVLLLQTYPSLLSPIQLRLAYATMVGAVSTSDDALAWWCIQELLAKIEVLPTASEVAVPSSVASADAVAAPASSADDAPSTVSPLESRALTLPRGAHLLALTALLPSVSLLLLPLVLSTLEYLVRLEPPTHDGRAALVDYAFEMLGQGMDARKRVEATRWWLVKGEALARAPAPSPRDDLASPPPLIILRRILPASFLCSLSAANAMSSSPGRSPAAAKPHRSFPHLSAADKPTLEDVARLIKEGKAKRVIVMAGAGISTSAGIPDFRSPGTGLYDNLQKYRLPYPEAIFDIDYLHDSPDAFYTLAKELYPGNFKPTTTHYFLKLLQDKGVLKGVWTQNIDTLERIAGIEDDYIVEAHGSFAQATCLHCGKKYSQEDIKPRILAGEVVRCKERGCDGRKAALIKPDIVFFGEGLPDRFFDRLSHFQSCDLLIVIGTSLTVGPFNTLLHRVPASTPRVLLNLEVVGEAEGPREQGFDFTGWTGKPGGVRDVKWLGKSDEGVEELCRLVGQGWAEDLKKLQEKGWARIDAAQADSTSAVPDAEEASAAPEPEKRQEEVIEAVGVAAGDDAPLEKGAVSAPKEGEEVVDTVVEELAKAVEKVEIDAAKIVEEGAAKGNL